MTKKRRPQYPVPTGPLRYPWLPADDEANVHNVWVPTPEEIEAECAKFRELQQRKPRIRNADPDNALCRVPCRKRGIE